MPTLVVSGLNFATSKNSIDSTGSTITSAYPVKSVLIKCVGGQCYFRRDSSVADNDSYVMEAGELITLDLKFDYLSSGVGVTICNLKALSGIVTIYMVIGY